MSADNYNLILQRADGTWLASPNHSMSDLMSREEARAYKEACKLVRPTDKIYDTQAEAYDAMDEEETEYGTFSHEWREWFEHYDD